MPIPLHFILHYAYRITLGAFRTKAIAPIAYIAGGSIFIATCTLTLICAIMQGFHTATLYQLRTIWPTVTIDGYDQELHLEALRTVIEEVPQIHAWAPQARRQAPLIVDGSVERIATILAINPTQEPRVSNLTQGISIAAPSLTQALDYHHILIGAELAEDLGYHVGDTLKLGLMDEQPENALQIKPIGLLITGIVRTGLEDIDSTLVMMSLTTYEDLFAQGPTLIGLAITQEHEAEQIAALLQQKLEGLAVYSFVQRNPAIFAALQLEQTIMTLLISLMALIAGTTLIALLFMVLTAHHRQLLILMLNGMHRTTLYSLAGSIGLFITIPASVAGITLGYMGAWILRDITPITLPPMYYVNVLPIELQYSYGLLIAAIAFCLALVAGICTSKSIAPQAIIQELK